MTTTDREAQAREKTGVESPIGTLGLDLSTIDENGIFVAVTTTGFRALDKTLDWKALGVTLPKNLAIAIRAPKAGMLPEEYRLPITRVDQQARAAMAHWSLRISILESLFGTTAYRWIPYSAWENFKSEWEEAERNLEAALAKLEADWPRIELRVVEDFRRVVGDAVLRAQSTGSTVEPDFQSRMIDQLEKMLPTPERLRASLSIEYRVAVVSLASSSLEEQRRALQEKRAIQREQEAIYLEEQERKAKEAVARAASEVEKKLIWENLRVEEEAILRKAKIQAELDAAKLAEAKKRMDETLAPMDEGLKQLHAVVYEAVSTVRDSMSKVGYLHGPSAEKVRKLSEWVSVMNQVFGDHDLAEKVSTLETLAQVPVKGEKRDAAQIERALDEVKDLTVAAFRDVNQSHRYDALQF